MDVDPSDGSLWVVSLIRLELIHLIPGGRSEVVRIPRLEGEGGFRDVLVDEEGIYVVPTCAEHALWKVDRKGKVLDRAFKREGEEIPLTLRTEFTPEEGQGSVAGCLPVSLARDLSGRITVFDGVDRTFYRHESGNWTPLFQVPDPELPAGGVRVDHPARRTRSGCPAGAAPATPWGSSSSAKSRSSSRRWRGESPKGAGGAIPPVHAPGNRRADGGLRALQGFSWFAPPLVVSDEHGFVSTLDNHLILGTFGGND